jgi:hypothetical protein
MNSSPKRLGINVFTAPGKAVVGERPRPFGEPMTKRYPDWELNQSWLMSSAPSLPNSAEE